MKVPLAFSSCRQRSDSEFGKKLTQRHKCARENTRVSVEVYEVSLRDDFGIGDAIRYVLCLRSRKQTRLRPRIPLALLRTCRQIFEEGSHFWYSTCTFYFDDSRALYEFVNTRPPWQQGIIRYLELLDMSGWYSRHEDCSDKNCPYRETTLRASQLLSITEKLQDLRTFNITTQYVHNAKDIEYYADSIHQVLRFVKASEAVTVTIDFRNASSYHSYLTARWEWDSHRQAQFAMTARALIRDPNGYNRAAAPTEKTGQSKFVLVAHIPI